MYKPGDIVVIDHWIKTDGFSVDNPELNPLQLGIPYQVTSYNPNHTPGSGNPIAVVYLEGSNWYFPVEMLRPALTDEQCIELIHNKIKQIKGA